MKSTLKPSAHQPAGKSQGKTPAAGKGGAAESSFAAYPADRCRESACPIHPAWSKKART